MSKKEWPKTNAHFNMIHTGIEILEEEGKEISQQKLGEMIGQQEESVTSSTAKSYLSTYNQYFVEKEPVKRLKKPENGGRATVYWIHKNYFEPGKHGKYTTGGNTQ